MSGTQLSQRELGNKEYLSVSPGLAPVLAKSRLEKAIFHYNEYLRTCCNGNDKASANKNAAQAHKKLASVLESLDDKLAAIKKAAEHFCIAYELGQTEKDKDWIENCYDLCAEMFQLYTSYIQETDVNSLLSALSRMYSCISNSSLLKGVWCLKHSKVLLGRCHMLQHGADADVYRIIFRLLTEANRPLADAQQIFSKMGSADYLLADANDVKESLDILETSCKSAQACEAADRIVDVPIYTEGDLDEDVMLIAIDMYKNALIQARGQDLENEAIALSRLGWLCKKVPHLKQKAMEYNTAVLHLAEALKPKIVHSERWYQVAMQSVQEHQQETIRREEEEERRKRDPILKELETELKALETAFNEGKIAYLKHIYSAHPPKNPLHKLPKDVSSDNLKDLYKQAILRYHPDKIRAQKQGEKRCVLHEEISKYLTRVWEEFK